MEQSQQHLDWYDFFQGDLNALILMRISTLCHNFPDPEGGGMVGSDYAIRQALLANGYTYTMGTILPADLSPYDVLFVIMGVYC